MNTKLYLIGVLLLSAVILNSCSKSNDSTPAPTPTPTLTSLTITVTNDQGTVASGASVYLYSSSADLINRTNQVATATTDGNGKVTFSSNMATIKYYWWVELGCQNNIRGINTSVNVLTANVNNTIATQLAQTGTLKMISTSSNPYELYINGVDIGTISGGAVKYYYYQPAGSLTVRVLQLSGYLFTPTDETFYPNITCGSTSTVAFP